MRKIIATGGAAAIVAALLSLPGAANAAPSDTRQVPSSGTTSIRATATGTGGLQQPELRAGPDDEGPAVPSTRPDPSFKHGIFPKHPLEAPVVASSAVAGANPAVRASIQGLNHRDQRLANGGNQFSLEPPDQALCVGNGFTVESVNSVLRVYDSDANPLTGVQDLNTFFGYPAAIDRTKNPPVVGPNVIDPICHYDPDFNRFVVAITTLDVDANGDFNGKNTIDVAVSNTGDPTGNWTVYHVPAQNDGTDGTPNHGCTTDGTTPGPCFQDYPHIGGDANGIYITTNEYDLFGPNFNAAQVFAFSKRQLSEHPASLGVTLVQNLDLAGTPGFTVWPATSPANQYATAANGTEFMLSSVAGDGSETGNPTGTARRIGLWALTNTASLDAATPDLRVTNRLVTSQTYVFPPKVQQKPGSIPLGECVNDTTLVTPFGPGCWQFFFDPADEPAHDEVISSLDANDTRMQQTWYTNGVLWGALDTAVRVNGQLRAGIAWFSVEPKINGAGKVGGSIKQQGYLALGDSDLTYPAIAMLPSGQGAIAFTVAGPSHYPSAGYVSISSAGTVGPIHIVGQGLGPDDGFTSYKAFVGTPIRTRWGDYGAAVTDGRSIWMASEYIAQTCTLQQYVAAPFGSCGGTRTSLGNWSTRLTKITP